MNASGRGARWTHSAGGDRRGPGGRHRGRRGEHRPNFGEPRPLTAEEGHGLRVTSVPSVPRTTARCRRTWGWKLPRTATSRASRPEAALRDCASAACTVTVTGPCRAPSRARSASRRASTSGTRRSRTVRAASKVRASSKRVGSGVNSRRRRSCAALSVPWRAPTRSAAKARRPSSVLACCDTLRAARAIRSPGVPCRSWSAGSVPKGEADAAVLAGAAADGAGVGREQPRAVAVRHRARSQGAGAVMTVPGA